MCCSLCLITAHDRCFFCRYQHLGTPAAGQQPTLSPQQQRVQQLLEQQRAAFAARAGGPVAPAAPASPPVPKRQRVMEHAVAHLAVEQPLPQYAVGRQWGTLFGSSSAGGGASSLGSSFRARRPFVSQLLAPAAVLDPPGAAALASNWGLSTELRWQLLPGCTASRCSSSGGSGGGGGGSGGGGGATEASPGRYFGAPASTVSSGSLGVPQGAAAWQQQYEQLLSVHPEDEQAWLSYAVRHAVEAARGGSGNTLPAGEVQGMFVGIPLAGFALHVAMSCGCVCPVVKPAVPEPGGCCLTTAVHQLHAHRRTGGDVASAEARLGEQPSAQRRAVAVLPPRLPATAR